jgi:phosphatidylserine decarboxylase
MCAAKTDDRYRGGQPFGMIKFGSCTELYLSAHKTLHCAVQKGDAVKAGLTVLARYKNAAD